MAANVTLEARLNFGAVRLDELAALAGCGRSKSYADIKAGILPVRKLGQGQGGRVVVPGPVARAYINTTVVHLGVVCNERGQHWLGAGGARGARP